MTSVSEKMWTDGVYMELGKLGKYQVVWSTTDAQNMLFYRWPAKGGEAFRSALDICASVLNGHLPCDEARHAFILAAEEAGLFIASTLPRHMRLVLPEIGAKSTDMKFHPKKRGMRT
ncbi:DUF982 domain-containing protein [Rhizobium tubonense]|uniref:DUF982 domain-containing protein n=1 Tax=Rhizobium tubonense TaxID=484088 RepID=A0A2W4EW48_9HYPH|nr:DUF982 domain-containing protein [Rhizobium tubonense]PZM14853.1 hypothetical protein CPY51_09145 [Rhizobium tubonense]